MYIYFVYIYRFMSLVYLYNITLATAFRPNYVQSDKLGARIFIMICPLPKTRCLFDSTPDLLLLSRSGSPLY